MLSNANASNANAKDMKNLGNDGSWGSKTKKLEIAGSRESRTETRLKRL